MQLEEAEPHQSQQLQNKAQGLNKQKEKKFLAFLLCFSSRVRETKQHTQTLQYTGKHPAANLLPSWLDSYYTGTCVISPW